jgi:hypothetical protein
MLQRYSEDEGNKPQTTRPHNPVNNVCNSGPDIFWEADIWNIQNTPNNNIKSVFGVTSLES